MDKANGFSSVRELTELVLRNAERMAFPSTDTEASILAESLLLPRVTVTRPPRDQLLSAGMVPYDCHVNCSAQAANDPDKLSRHVTGWLPFGSNLILHSVVERAGKWLCLTPQLMEAPPTFSFIPDPHIVWQENEDGSNDPYRHGTLLPDVLRKFPELHIRMRDELVRLMASGMTALAARDQVDRTLGVELRRLGRL